MGKEGKLSAPRSFLCVFSFVFLPLRLSAFKKIEKEDGASKHRLKEVKQHLSKPHLLMESEDELIDICDAEPAAPMMDGEIKSQSDETSHADQLERCGRWLSSIPRDDVMILRQTPEYEDFLRAFESLGDAHRRVASMTRKKKKKKAPSTWNNFSKLTAEDVVLRIFEFLECQSLIRTALTYSRFRQLAHRSATQRTYDVANSRQLNSVMQLLRAKEQIGGVGNGILDSHVRVPILLLSRRVIVTNSGDPDYNGVYFCTGSNGNGFVFTKPRFPERRIQRPPRQRQGFHLPVEGLARPFAQQEELDPPEPIHAGAAAVGAPRADEGPAARFEREVAQPGQLLRCIIAKRFSNEVRELSSYARYCTSLLRLIDTTSCRV